MIDKKYGRVTLENRMELTGSDEPCFVFRAQDKYAETAIRFYATLVAAGDRSTEFARRIMETADRFAEWPVEKKKKPD